MPKPLKRVAVLTSGGDAPGMNACIRAVVRTAKTLGIDCLGVLGGYQGLVEGETRPLDSLAVANILQRGGTILKTARSRDFLTPDGRARAWNNLQHWGVQGLVVIGGDGTYAGANQFGAEYPDLQVAGCPGTIDNDLTGTDFTIGFDTAVNTVVQAVDRIRDTADAHNRVFFVEVMGRHAGGIALHAGLAVGAEAILIPETPTDLDDLVKRLGERTRKKAFSIVLVAEGDEAGGAMAVAQHVQQHLELDARVSILGHMQRGGSPTAADRLLASQLGAAAVQSLAQGQTGVALGVVNAQVQQTPFAQAVRAQQKLNPALLNLMHLLAD